MTDQETNSPRPGTARVAWFEIAVTDLDRAVAFYQSVLGVTLERTIIDGHDMALFPEVGPTGGANGSLAIGETYVPSLAGTLIYFTVPDIASAMERVLRLGGCELFPRTYIGEDGYVAEFQDSEGNRIGLSAPE